MIALLSPHSTKPPANAGYDGTSVHRAKQPPYNPAASTSSTRRDTTSAHAPDGTSSASVVTDQMTNNVEISLVDRPVSAKRTAYTGKYGMHSCSAAYATTRPERHRGTSDEAGQANGFGNRISAD